MGSFVRNKVFITGGSDWTVSSINPLDAIEVAITRKSIYSSATEQSWLPNETLDLPTALAAYTINGAYANHLESITGSIEIGKTADLIVLNNNLFKIPPNQIHNTKVVLTMFQGKIVFVSDSFKQLP